MEHMMVIPDGDRRYAEKAGISKIEAYRKAAKVVRNLVEWILVENNVTTFTFFGLSYNNVKKRKEEDIEPIIRVQIDALNSFAGDNLFHDNKIRVLIHGLTDLLPSDYQKAVRNVEKATEKYTQKRLNLLLGYSGQLDMEQSLAKLIRDGKKLTLENVISSCQVNQPIDFLVRTAGENRISDGPFFLTQYTEFYSIPAYFPALTKKDIFDAIAVYNNRKRTFGL